MAEFQSCLVVARWHLKECIAQAQASGKNKTMHSFGTTNKKAKTELTRPQKKLINTTTHCTINK